MTFMISNVVVTSLMHEISEKTSRAGTACMSNCQV